MDEIEMLRRYGAQFDDAAVPAVNVTSSVMETLRRTGRRKESVGTTRPLMLAAAASWLIALTCGYIAVQAWAAIDDPVTALVAPLVVAL